MSDVSLRRLQHCLLGFVVLLTSVCALYAQPSLDPTDDLTEEEARQIEIAKRFLTVLERNPRRGTALDRVYGHHVEFGTLDDLLAGFRENVEQNREDGTTWMLLGLFESHRGEDGNAVDAFRQAADLRPEDPLAPYYLGQSLLLIGQPEQAVAAFEQALERKPQRSDLLEIYQQLGRVHQRAQRTEKALAVWQRLEEQFPDDPRVQELIAVTLVEEGQYAQALPRYERLAELVKDDYRRVVYQVEAAELKIRENRRQEGLQDLESVLANLNPNGWLHRDVRRRIEEVFLRTDDQDGLVQYYENWTEAHPEDVDATARLAKFLASSARVPEATEWMEKALKLAPTRTELRKAFIDQLVDEQRYSDALAQYELLLEATPANADFLRDWGKLVLRDKSQDLERRQQEAARIWQQIVDARPQDAVTAAQVADLFRQAHMNDRAIKLYKHAVELAPEDPQYREYLGEFYHVLKQPEKALETWAEIAADSRRTALNVARLAEVYNSFGYLEQAVTEIAEACHLDPKDFSLQITAAEYHTRAGKFDEALGFLATADTLVANDDEREQVLKNRIEVFQSSRRLDEETEELAAKLKEKPDATVEDWHVLARYCEADRRWSDATEAIERALSLNDKAIPALATAGRIAELSGDFALAADRSRQLARVDRRSRSDHLMNVARLEAQMGRTDEAFQAGKDLLVSAPGNTDNYEFFAQLCFQLGKTEEGLDALRKAVRINPTEPHLIVALGSALAQQFRTDEAIEVYWRAFDKSDEIDDKTSLTVKLTELYLQINQFDKLIERLERGRQEDERRRAMTICIAQAHHTSGDYGTARQELESLLSQESHDTNLLQQLSKLCEEGSDLDAAVDYQRRLVEIAPGPETEFRLAGLLQSRGDRDEASEILVRLSRREEDPSRLLRSIDSLLTQGNYESVIAITEPLLSQQRDDWELLYREGVAWSSLENRQEARDRFERLLSLTMPHETLGIIAEERFKQAQRKAKSNNLRGLQSQMPKRQSPLHMLGMSSQVRQAVGLDVNRYYGSGPQRVWTPESYGVARMAAYGWLMKFEQDDEQGELAEQDDSERAASDEKTLFDGLTQAASKTDADRETLYDWLYVEQLRGNYDSIFRESQRLAREGGKEEKRFFLSSLRTRTINGQSQQVRSSNSKSSKEPLQKDELELMLDCYADLSEDDLSQDAMAAAFGGQVAYASNGQMYVNVGGNWIQVSGIFSGEAFLGTIIEELKLAGRTEQAEQLIAEKIERAKNYQEISTAMNLLFSEERWQDLDALYPRWLTAAEDALPQMPTAKTSRSSRQGAGPLAMSSTLIARWIGKLGPEEEHAQILSILDPALDLAIAEAKHRRANRPPRRRNRSMQQNYSNYLGLYYGKENLRVQLEYPRPNEYVDYAALMLLREVYEVFQRNGVTNDLAAHLRERLDQAAPEDKLYEQLLLGYDLWWSEEQEDAVAVLTEAADSLTDDPSYRLEIAMLYEHLGDVDDALEIVDSIKPRDQQLVRDRETMALVLAERLGDRQRARQAAERLFGLRLDNDTQLALVDRMRRLGLHDMAEAVISRVRRRAGNQTTSLAMLMALYQGQGKTDLAEQIAHTILRRTTSPITAMASAGRNPLRYRSGSDGTRNQALQLLHQTGALREIIARLEEQLKRSPESPRLYDQLIEFYQAAGNREKVGKLLAQGVEQRPEAPELRLQLAQHLEQMGKAKEACDHYLVLLHKKPGWLADDFYRIRRIFDQAQRSLDLIKELKQINLQSLGHPYYAIDLVSELLQERGGQEISEEDTELALSLFERLYETFPAYRNQMMTRIYNDKLWKNERLYSLAKRAVVPNPQEAATQPWFGINDIYSYSSGGQVNAMFHRMLNGIRGTDKVQDLRDAITEGLKEAPGWLGGEAMLALMDLKENKKDEAKQRLEKLVADEEVLKQMPSDACWIVGQELDQFEDTRDVALRLFENAAFNNTQSQNQMQYSPISRLVQLYGKLNRKTEARDLLIKHLRSSSTDMYDAQYSAYLRIENSVWVGQQLLDLGFAVDAVRTYREIVDDRTALEQAGQWYGNRPEYFTNQAENGLKRALESIDATDAASAMEQLLEAPEQIAADRPVLDLMLSRPDAKSVRSHPLESSLVGLLDSLSSDDAIAEQVDARLSALREEYPQDLSVGVIQVLHRLHTNNELVDKALQQLKSATMDLPLVEIPSGRRPNSRQRREALAQVPLWLVARECLADPDRRQFSAVLGERALEAAKRQVGNEYAVSILFQWGQLAIDAGDRATAERKWSELLDLVTERPERKDRAPSPDAAGRPQPAVTHSGMLQPAIAILQWVAFLSSEDSAAEEPVPPLTVSQFRLAIEVALAAAENDMPELSQRAVRATLAGGMPVADLDDSSSAAMGRVGLSMAVAARVQLRSAGSSGVSGIEAEVARSLRKVFLKWQSGDYPAADVYQILVPLVLPASRPAEILLYPDSSRLNDAQVTSLGATLVDWADKAEELSELEGRIAERESNPQSVVPALVLRTMIALAQDDRQLADKHLQTLHAEVKKSGLPHVMQLACHAALPASAISELEESAYAILQSAVQQKYLSANTSGGAGEIGALLGKVSQFLAAKPAVVKEFYEGYLVARQAQYARYGGDYGLYIQWQDLAKIAKEAAKAGVTDVAVDFMGRVCDFTYKNNSRPGLAMPLAVVFQQLRSASALDRYEKWSQWTLPVEGRQTVRILGEWLKPIRAPDAFVPEGKSAELFGSEQPVSNLQELVEAAAEAGKLNDLRTKTKEALDQNLPGAEALWPLVLLRAGDAQAARAAIDKLVETLPERGKRQQNQPPPNLWGDYLVYRACLASKDYAPLYSSDREKLVGALRGLSNVETVTHLDYDLMRRRADDLDSMVLPGLDSQLIHWIANSPRDNSHHLPATWIVQEGHVAHLPGPGIDLLTYAYPLVGEFEFSVDCYSGSWADDDAGYGGIFVESTRRGSQLTISPISGHETLYRPRTLCRPGFNKVTVRVADGQLKYLLNNRLVYEESASPTSPWLTLFTHGPRKTVFRNLSISGNPAIPRHVDLLHEDRMDGWICNFFGDSQPRRRLMAEKPKSENDRVYYEQEREPAEPDWRCAQGMLLGKSADSANDRQSWIYYHRPLQDQETFSYQFYYSPDTSVAQPTVGRLAFLLEPAGVEVHWIAQADWDDAVLGIPLDNQITEPECRRGPEELPLKPNDWNEVTVTLREDRAVIALNGTLIYERPLEAENDRMFGLFRYKRQALKVRDAQLAGPWPEAFTDELRDNLVATRADFSPADRRVMSEILTDECFEHDLVPLLEELESLSDEQKLPRLEEWVLPGPSRANFRLYYRHASDGSDIESAGGKLLCPAWELVEVAGRLTQSDELRARVADIEPSSPLARRNRQAMLALIAIEAGDDESALKSIAELGEMLSSEIPKTVPRRDRAAEYLVAWHATGKPALRSAGADLAKQLRALQQDKQTALGDAFWRRDLDALKGHAFLALTAAEYEGLNSVDALTQWQRVAIRQPQLQASGYPAARWFSGAATLKHCPGVSLTQLFFQSPLRGKFEILSKRSTAENREMAVAYGRHSATPRHDLKATLITSLPMKRSNDSTELKVPDWGDAAEFRTVVDGSKITTFANGVQIHEEILTAEPDPWLVLQALSASNEGSLQDVRIVGDPEIPAEIDLIRSAGWNVWKSDLYGESFSADASNENAVWRHVGEEIVGQLREDLSACPIECLLAYQRPMLEDGTIEFEAYYESGSSEVHPALGTLALLTRADGVVGHNLTAGQWETDDLQPDNERPIAGSANSVPLREKDWNRYALEVSGDKLTLSVNDQLVAEVQLKEPPAQRFFGLFRYADQTRCRVRNVVYRGDWPKALPDVAGQELAGANRKTP